MQSEDKARIALLEQLLDEKQQLIAQLRERERRPTNSDPRSDQRIIQRPRGDQQADRGRDNEARTDARPAIQQQEARRPVGGPTRGGVVIDPGFDSLPSDVDHRSWSTVNLRLPILPSDADDADGQPTMFAFAQWFLPRVPCIGEHVGVRSIGHRVIIEKVLWDSDGSVVVTLRPVRRPPPEALARLERDGWEVAPWDGEPRSEWLS